MAIPSTVASWAHDLAQKRVETLESVRKKAAQNWKGGKYVHKLRTSARRLRAALEDLHECIACAGDLLDDTKTLADALGTVRDADVLVERLQRYRRFALPAERAEIDVVCRKLNKGGSTSEKQAKYAIKDVRFRIRT